METSAEQVQNEYTQLMNWAELYGNCSFDAKKMIVAQFVKFKYNSMAPIGGIFHPCFWTLW